jgi:hypothetical protein
MAFSSSFVGFIGLVSVISEIVEFVAAVVKLMGAGLYFVGMVVIELGRLYCESRQTMGSWDSGVELESEAVWAELEAVEVELGEDADLEDMSLEELFEAADAIGVDEEGYGEVEHYGEEFSEAEGAEFGAALEAEFAEPTAEEIERFRRALEFGMGRFSGQYAYSLGVSGQELTAA